MPDSEPPDKTNENNPTLLSDTNKNRIDPNTDRNPIDPQRDKNFDAYREPDSEDEDDIDTQSLGEGTVQGEDKNSHHHHKDPLLHPSNADEIREVTGKQGLSPRGRKPVKQNKQASNVKPNTRARSRGV